MPGQLGEDLVRERRVGDRLAVVVEADRAARAGERLLELAGLRRRPRRPARSRWSIDRPGVGGGVPRAERVEIAGGARHPAGDGQLDRPLDRRLAGLVRAAHDGQAGRQVDVEVAVAPEVVQLRAGGSSQRHFVAGEQQPPEAERIAQLGGLVGAVRAASSSAIRASRSRMKAPDDGVGRGQGALGQRGHPRRRGRGP